jgi:putative transposase
MLSSREVQRVTVLLFPRITETRREGPVRCRERLGGFLRYYPQDAA